MYIYVIYTWQGASYKSYVMLYDFVEYMYCILMCVFMYLSALYNLCINEFMFIAVHASVDPACMHA